jgi:hypothetical protein
MLPDKKSPGQEGSEKAGTLTFSWEGTKPRAMCEVLSLRSQLPIHESGPMAVDSEST